MPNSSLLNVPRTKSDWDTWSLNHMLEHQKILQAIQQQKGIALVQYQLDPINFENPTFFLELHQQSHLDFDGALGLQSSDLQDVDLKDEKQLQSFIYINWLEHNSANAALKI